MSDRLCLKCIERKSLDNFSKDKSSEDGLNLVCKKCNNERTSENRQKNIQNNKIKLADGRLDRPNEIKRCRICKDTKPATSEFWPRDMGRRDGFNTACKICVAEKQKRPNEVLARMKQNAKRKTRNLKFTITIDDIEKHWGKPCHFCGKVTIGWLDRLDNSRGYEPDNVVPCCAICNKMKLDLSEEEFYKHIKKIIKNLSQK